MRKRLLKVVEHLGITAAALERACGWSGGTITTATDGLSAKKIASLHQAYPDINLTWLITGEGEITANKPYKEGKGTITPPTPDKRENEAEIAFLRRLVQDQQNTIMALVVKKENND